MSAENIEDEQIQPTRSRGRGRKIIAKEEELYLEMQ